MIKRIKLFFKNIPLAVKIYSAFRRLVKIDTNQFRSVRLMLEKQDREYLKQNPILTDLHHELNELRDAQNKKWKSHVYCDGYFYQGFQKIGISGIKPTERRMENYSINQYFDKTKSCLDIGSNAGFLSCHLAESVKLVDAIELNPFLLKMGEAVKSFLELQNVNFIHGDFISYEFQKKYDLIFSLSVCCIM